MGLNVKNTSVQELTVFGQSVWLDNISRAMIKSGNLKKMIWLGLRGMTSNPTIFDKAISSGVDYDDKILELSNTAKSTFEIYDELTITDIQDATDIFLPVYKESGGIDGYVSLEINPKLAYKTEETVREGMRLSQKVNRPNVMFKVPSTEVGFKAIEDLVAAGLNINITLIFSLAQYIKTAEAYLRGIRRLLQNRGEATKVHSVASVFVSRIDTYVDNLLDQLALKEENQGKKAQIISLKGKTAVSNCSLIYKKYLEIFSSPDFKELKTNGANIQRVLWGSTSTKNPNYSDIKYVTELIARDTVNTMPEQTFNAFLDHGQVKEFLIQDVNVAIKVIDDLKKIGIDINDVCTQLLKDGVAAFEKSFGSLLSSLENKKCALCK